jgi:hypothetical protein
MRKNQVLFCMVFFLVVCRTTQDEPPVPLSGTSRSPTKVILSFDVFNHTQGLLAEFSRKAKAGEILRFKISEFGVDGIDQRRIVIREGRLGPRVAFGKLGECEFVSPEQDTDYTIYLMNSSSGAEYRAVDVWVGIYEGKLRFPRKMKWYFENRDGFEGQVDPITEVICQLNDALNFPWSRYGQFIQVPVKNMAHFFVGYGFCKDEYGWHTLKWAGINPEHCSDYRFRLETFLEEIFELVTGTENIAEKDSVSMIANQTTGQLNEVGRDLLAYIFVKDVR